MLDIKKWEREDIIYAILSMSISAVIVSVVLIQQNGLFAKTIMFAIISVLIYFVLKYIQEHRRKVNKKSVYKSKVSIKASNKEKISVILAAKKYIRELHNEIFKIVKSESSLEVHSHAASS